MSKADAEKLCEDTFEKLGISAQAYEIESFDIAALKKLSDENRDEQQEWLDLGKEAYIKDDWTQDDECYRIKLYQTIDGIPVTARGYYIKSRDLPLGGTYLDALVTRSGVEYIYAYGLLKTLETADSITPCTQKEALGSLHHPKKTARPRAWTYTLPEWKCATFPSQFRVKTRQRK